MKVQRDPVRAYVYSRMTALGYKEHENALSFEDVPAQKMQHGAFMCELGAERVVSTGVNCIDTERDFTVKVAFMAGIRNNDKVSEGLSRVTALIADLTQIANVRESSLTHVKVSSHNLQALNEHNENAVLFDITFIARLVRAIT
jgi:hypothetical protein